MHIVHAADLHIDSPLRGLVRYPGAPIDKVRGATRRAFENLISLCLEQRSAVLMLSGDLFDREWRDFNTGLFFVHELNRLRDSGTQVLIVRGNHDAKNAVTRGLRYPEHVFEFSAERAETKVVQGVAFHGQSFAETIVDRDLSLAYPEAHRDLVNVGLLHTSLDGREGHDPYAPTRVSVLRERGYDYWALGHVHAREIVSDAPWIVYPGNLQGRNIRETGAKGAMHFRVEQGAVKDVSFAPLDVLRFEHVRLAI